MNRRDFFGRMAGILCGAAVAPRLLQAVELPSAPALAVPPSVIARSPEVLEHVVLTNEVIARLALEMLRKNLAFVKARRVEPHHAMRIGDILTISRPPRILGKIDDFYPYENQSALLLRYCAVDMSTSERYVNALRTPQYVERLLEPAMYTLAQKISENLIGSRGLYCVDQLLPADTVDGVNVAADDFSLRMLHWVDHSTRHTRTSFDVLYGVDRGRK